MQAVILAAGIGQRFEDRLVPKPLLPLLKKTTILGRQLELLANFLPLDRVSVVVGYKSEEIMAAFPNLHFIENPYFASTNTAKSLFIALDALPEEDLLWLNGDVVFHETVLRMLFHYGMTAMVVNKDLVEVEEVKYRTDGAGQILEVSKTVKEAEGEALGINFFAKSDLPILKKELKKCSKTDFFEKGVEGCIQKGVEVGAVVVPNNFCVEVDFPDDLERANALLASWP